MGMIHPGAKASLLAPDARSKIPQELKVKSRTSWGQFFKKSSSSIKIINKNHPKSSPFYSTLPNFLNFYHEGHFRMYPLFVLNFQNCEVKLKNRQGSNFLIE